MDEFNTVIIVFLGILMRIGIPVAVTVLLVWFFGLLDSRWKKEAEQREGQLFERKAQARNQGCWEINNCPPEQLESCPAYARVDTPCWQVFRGKDGLLQERCLGCRVFTQAPLPVGD